MATSANKAFNLSPEQRARAQEAIERYKGANPHATDAQALDAFCAAWRLQAAMGAMPGSEDVLRTFEGHMAGVRTCVAALADAASSARGTERAIVEGELDGLRVRNEALESKIAGLESDKATLEAKLRVAEVEIADLRRQLAKHESLEGLVDRLGEIVAEGERPGRIDGADAPDGDA